MPEATTHTGGWPKGKPRGPLSATHRRKLRGSRNGQAQLSEDQVRRIKRRLARGDSTWDLAHTYGVSHTAIWMIREGRTWAWVLP